MADETVTQDDRDNHELLSKKLGQLQAMLMMTYGNARETIDSMSDDLRDSYFWACADMANDCIELNDLIGLVIFPNTTKLQSRRQAEASHA